MFRAKFTIGFWFTLGLKLFGYVSSFKNGQGTFCPATYCPRTYIVPGRYVAFEVCFEGGGKDILDIFWVFSKKELDGLGVESWIVDMNIKELSMQTRMVLFFWRRTAIIR